MIQDPRRTPGDSNGPLAASVEGALDPYELLARNARDIVLFIRGDGRIVEANEAAVVAYGYSRAELLEMSILDLRAPGTVPSVAEQMNQADRYGVLFETVHRRRDGGEFPVEVSSRGADVAGERLLLSIIRDITERRRAEEALREADRRKDEFLATLAHELRNPLAPIRNAVQILRARGEADPELRWARDVIDRQVRQLARLVDDLLDVSRLTRGRIELHREPVDLAAVVERALETSRPLLEAGRHHLAVAGPGEPLTVEADLTRMAQALSNLLNNAAKYSRPGGEVQVSLSRAGDEAVIRVRDEGIGIPPEMLPRIFDMFFQVDSSLERLQGGLGIGLTIARSLVEMQGGALQAASEGTGKGSEFTITLPVAPAVEEPVRPESPGEEREREREPDRGLRILVVDDNEDSADSLALWLELKGHQVRAVYDGPEALTAAAEAPPDVVLLDIGMPGMNGYDVARRLRERQDTAEALIVAMTGWGQEEDRRRSREAGFNHHLVKPVDPGVLQELLDDRRKSL